MPSPYGQSRSAAAYYQYGGVPRHYIFNWEGGPPPGTRAATTRALGDYFDIVASARYHRDLSGYPVAMSMQSGQSSVLHSGPEQSHLIDAAPLSGFSTNEKYLAGAAIAGVVGYLVWKARKKR